MNKLSNGKKKDISLFQWRLNKETGKYEQVPVEFHQRITPRQFWDSYAWKHIRTHYDEDVMWAVEELLDEMPVYPEARMIMNRIRCLDEIDNSVDKPVQLNYYKGLAKRRFKK